MKNQFSMIRQFVVVMVILVSLSAVSAQEVLFKKEHFPDQKKELKAAKKQMKKGTRLASKGLQHREEALRQLKAAHSFNPDHAALNYTIGNVLYQGINPSEALPYFEKAYSLNNNVSDDIQYLLGRSYHLNHKFDHARLFYEGFLSSLKPKEARRWAEQISLLVTQTVVGDSLVFNTTDCFVDNLGDRINSEWHEYSPVLSHDGKRLWFTSRRPGSTGGKTDKDYLHFEDIYYVEKTGSIWSDPINAGPAVNTEKHESVVALAPDNSTIYIRMGNPTGDFYMVNLEGKKRRKPAKLDKRLNSKFNETTLTFSPDSSKVWFASDRRGGYGGKDIWMSEAKKRGGWKKPVNAGPVINTPFDEESPFICADGKTFWFSSKGHDGMGGFDIFITYFSDTGYTKPVNVGYPINSASDDIHFSMDARQNIGHFASSRPGGVGGFDIYRVKTIDRSKPLLIVTDEIKIDLQIPGAEILDAADAGLQVSETAILLDGTVRCANTLNPVAADIIITDAEAISEGISTLSSSENGRFFSVLPTGKMFRLIITAQGYMPHYTEIDMTGITSFAESSTDLRISPLARNQHFDLPGLNYAHNNPEPDAATAAERDVILNFLNKNSEVIIRIAGFTRLDEDQDDLSRARAIAIKNYLESNGITGDRIMIYQPTEDSEEEFQAVYDTGQSDNSIRIFIVSVE